MVNPYEPPEGDCCDGVQEGNKRPITLDMFLWPTLAGAVIGYFVLPPVTRCVGDPSGEGIAIGLGGLIAFVLTLVILVVKRLLQR
ncbi:MAG: hypothetical protein KDA85_18815 [Planctomycetaceae bacterium]|nr:hypothetical protein [Planctomycetaceae bacterium]